MKKNIIFYSSVNNISDFNTSSFYEIDIKILSELGYNIHVTNKVSSFLKFWKYDIAYIYFYRKGVIVGFLARIFGKRVYYTGGIDDLSPTYAKKKDIIIQRILFKICYMVSTLCIIVSYSDFENIKIFFKNEKKLIVIPHAILTEKFVSNTKKCNIITSVCWMGSIENVKRKGVDQLVKAFSIIKRVYPSFVLYIIGRKGPGYNYLQKIINENYINNDIIFTGAISENEKVEILAKSKYYGQLSKFEGFGLAAIEAMSSNCIVIHSGQGGLRETVGEYGVLVNNINDPKSIAQAIIDCESHIEYYKEKAKKGYRNTCTNYDYKNRFLALKNILL